MRWKTGILALVTAAACSSNSTLAPQVSAVLNEEFPMRVGQQVVFGSEPLRITFESVAEDSRCPIDVVCVWQGNGKVRLRATSSNANPQTLDLNTGIDPHSASALGYDIALERLEPIPRSDTRITQDRYVAYLKVTRK